MIQVFLQIVIVAALTIDAWKFLSCNIVRNVHFALKQHRCYPYHAAAAAAHHWYHDQVPYNTATLCC